MAYGARLESVLGASPRGFESPILRHRTPGPLQVPGFLLLVAPLVFRAAEGPAAVCAGGRRRLIGQVVLVFGLSFVATKPKGGGWTRCDLSSWLARSCWFYPGF